MANKIIFSQKNILDISEFLFEIVLRGIPDLIIPGNITKLKFMLKNNAMFVPKIVVSEQLVEKIADRFIDKYSKFLIQHNKKKQPSAGTKETVNASVSKAKESGNEKINDDSVVDSKEIKKNIFINKANIKKYLSLVFSSILNFDVKIFDSIFTGELKRFLKVNHIYKNNATIKIEPEQCEYLAKEFYSILVKNLKLEHTK